MGHRSGVGLSQGSGIGGDVDTDGLDQVKSSHSRPGSSRPISSRPMSSRHRTGSGVGNRRSFEGKNRKGGTSTSMDKSHGGRRKKKSGNVDSDDGSSDDDDDDEKGDEERRKMAVYQILMSMMGKRRKSKLRILTFMGSMAVMIVNQIKD